MVVANRRGFYWMGIGEQKKNVKTFWGNYFILKIGECINSWGDAEPLLKLGDYWGYWQIANADWDKDKATITSHVGTYGLHRVLLGLMRATKTILCCLDINLNILAWMTNLLYIDDIMTSLTEYQLYVYGIDSVLNTLLTAGVHRGLLNFIWSTTKVYC